MPPLTVVEESDLLSENDQWIKIFINQFEINVLYTNDLYFNFDLIQMEMRFKPSE
jgi:hypothetical protein